jgi:ABC-type bacteriocin/lantibiotic exporter with double-glycine peptidase domain
MKEFRAKEVQWLLRRAKPLMGFQLASLACTTAGSVLTLADPLIMKWLIDTVIPRRQLTLLIAGVLGFAVLYMCRLTLTYCGVLLNFVALQKLMFRTRMVLIRALHLRSGKEYEDHHPGEVLYRVEQDVARIGELGGDILPSITRMFIVAVMVLVTMCVINLRLTALILPLLPCFYFLQKKYHAQLLHAAENTQQQLGKTSSILQEHLVGMLQLILLNRQGRHAWRYAQSAAEGAKCQTRQRIAEIHFSASYLSLIVLGSTAILGYGGYEVIKGELTIGGLVAFYSYVTRLFEPMMIAVDLQSRIQRVTASIRRIMEIESFKHKAKSLVGARRLNAQMAPDIEFRAVSFSHAPDREILRDISFRIKAGEKVAIVGRSGSGKSTIAGLAVGLYLPTAGNIFIGGDDIVNIDRRSLRSFVSLVPQDPVLFNGTLRENLFFGDPAATAGDLDEVLFLTHLHGFVSRLPRGLDENLGPIANQLSGGEKKRVALARAMLRRPRIIILDEITGALDGNTTERILQGIDAFRKNRTVMLISHKPMTITWADTIIVLEEGRIVDIGSHVELVQRSNVYESLIREHPAVSSGAGTFGHVSAEKNPWSARL